MVANASGLLERVHEKCWKEIGVTEFLLYKLVFQWLQVFLYFEGLWSWQLTWWLCVFWIYFEVYGSEWFRFVKMIMRAKRFRIVPAPSKSFFNYSFSIACQFLIFKLVYNLAMSMVVLRFLNLVWSLWFGVIQVCLKDKACEKISNWIGSVEIVL